MKTHLLSLVCVLLSIQIKAQPFIPFPTDGAIWINTLYEYTFNPPNPVPISTLTDVENYCVNGEDTTIQGQDYTKVFYCGDVYKGALRDVDGMVYFVPSDSVNEFLLYDFGAQQGETIEDVYIGNHWDESFMLMDFTVNQHLTEFIGGMNRRVVYADNFRWIEGIGCETGLFMEPWQNVSNYAVYLECMSLNGTRLFPTDGNETCPLTVGIQSTRNDVMQVNAYPNPASGEVTVTWIATSATVTVLDALGKVVSDDRYTGIRTATINLYGPNGVYIVRVLTDDGAGSRLRVVKH